jgi:hypothetical protein
MLLELAERLLAQGRGDLGVDAGVLDVLVAEMVGHGLACPSPWSPGLRAGGAAGRCAGARPRCTQGHKCAPWPPLAGDLGVCHTAYMQLYAR